MKLILTVVVAFSALMIEVASAGVDLTVGQKGRVFSVRSVKARRGEAVTFVNDDTVPHNIMSMTKNNRFDLGSQLPGTAVPVTFDSVGVVEVICAIHPRMQMTIEIAD